MSELDPDILADLEKYLDGNYDNLFDNLCKQMFQQYVGYMLRQRLAPILEPYFNEALKNFIARHKAGPLARFVKDEGSDKSQDN